MKPDERTGSDVKVEIQRTLRSINQLTLKIKNELGVINELLKENGQLHTAVINANKTLTTVAQTMDVDVENVLSNNEEEDNLTNLKQTNLKNPLSSVAFQQRIIACLSMSDNSPSDS